MTEPGLIEQPQFHKELALIERTSLGYEDHGILTAWLHVAYEESSSGQGIGGYALDDYKGERGKGRRVGTAWGCEYIARTMKAVGVQTWEDLKGKRVWVLKESGDWHAKVVGIEGLRSMGGHRFLFSDLKEA